MYKNPVCASQETNSGYCKHYIKYPNTFFGQIAEFSIVIRDWKTGTRKVPWR
jgi:hypothetical protein